MDDNFSLADLDLERTILGQMLGHGAYPLYRHTGVTSTAFYRDIHQRIYNASAAIHQGGAVADIMTIRQHDATLDPSYIFSLPDGIPRPRQENANYFAERLLKLSEARECYYSAMTLHKAIEQTPSNVDGAVEAHLAVLDQARKRHDVGGDKYDSRRQWDAYRDSLKRDESRVYLGIGPLDAIIGGVRRGEVCGVMARPGIGKTLFLGHMIGLAVDTNVKTLMFSLEMPVEQIVSRLARSTYGVGRHELESAAISGRYDGEQYQSTYGSLSVVDTPGLSMADIERRISAEDDVQLVIIDHLGLIGGGRSLSTYDRVSQIARQVKEVAKRTHTAIMLAVQVSREAGGDGSRELTLGAARDSGIIEEVMDYLLAMRRPERSTSLTAMQRSTYQDILLYSLLKNRHGEIGHETAVKVDPITLTMSVEPGVEWDDALETIGRVRRGGR
jgi:replicative DNA helicase